jgi:hypothetical protein
MLTGATGAVGATQVTEDGDEVTVSAPAFSAAVTESVPALFPG